MDATQAELEKGRLEHASSEEIRDEIRGTRREMNDTLDELGDRLHPRHLLDDVIDLFKGSDAGGQSREQLFRASQKVGRGIAEQVRVHPLPAVLAGIAIARWIYESSTAHDSVGAGEFDYPAGTYPQGGAGSSGPGLGEKAHDVLSRVSHKVSGAAEAVGEKMSGAAGNVGERVSGAAESGWERVRESGRKLGHFSAAGGQRIERRANQLGDRLKQASDEFPIPIGGVFLVAGLLAGLTLPRTASEDEWIGEAADQFKEQTKAKGEELVERGRDLAESAAASAIDEAEARGMTPGDLVDKAAKAVGQRQGGHDREQEEQGLSAGGTIAGMDPAKQKGKWQAEEAEG